MLYNKPNYFFKAFYYKKTKLYDVYSGKFIYPNTGSQHSASWSIVKENISAKSPAGAVSKVKNYLVQMQGSPKKDVYHGYRGGDNTYPDLLTWVCTWKVKNSNITVEAVSLSK